VSAAPREMVCECRNSFVALPADDLSENDEKSDDAQKEGGSKMKKIIRTLFESEFYERFVRGTVFHKTCAMLKSIPSKHYRNLLVKRRGVSTLKQIQAHMEEAKIDFFFDFGTLLGIIREGHLLNHDLDMDIGVILKPSENETDIRKHMLEVGRLKYVYFLDDVGLVEESYMVNGIKVDVNYYRTLGDRSICYLLYREQAKKYRGDEMNAVELASKRISITKARFIDTDVNVPDNCAEYLETRYGSNWKIPDKNWCYWAGPSARKIPNMAHIQKF